LVSLDGTPMLRIGPFLMRVKFVQVGSHRAPRLNTTQSGLSALYQLFVGCSQTLGGGSGKVV
jgi:hypothetical protein